MNYLARGKCLANLYHFSLEMQTRFLTDSQTALLGLFQAPQTQHIQNVAYHHLSKFSFLDLISCFINSPQLKYIYIVGLFYLLNCFLLDVLNDPHYWNICLSSFQQSKFCVTSQILVSSPYCPMA